MAVMREQMPELQTERFRRPPFLEVTYRDRRKLHAPKPVLAKSKL
jgi:hypothetical protein